MSTKFQRELADRIQIKKKLSLWIALIFLVVICVGVYYSQHQWYWGFSFTIFFLMMFRLRMYTWKMAIETLELLVFLLPTLIMIGVLIYLYFQNQLNWGVSLQIIASAPFSIILMRSLFFNNINEIARDLRKRYN